MPSPPPGPQSEQWEAVLKSFGGGWYNADLTKSNVDSAGRSRSLYFSTEVTALRRLHPDLEVLRSLGDETRLVVSEPLGDLPGAWNEVPESMCGIVRPGTDELVPFRPVTGALTSSSGPR